MELALGTVIDGRYRLERLLGRGGMGAVYAARHLTLGELYALKFVSPGPGDRDEAHARFRREAKSAALLTSDHVAKVIDVGVHGDDDLYIVMEHLDGTDLEILARRRGRVSVEEASTYVLQACEALAEAHAKNIVHRDIKPANLFLTTSHGEPLLKVLDFGVSKTLGADMTQTAAILGSPKYMSPEQMDDPRSVDGRTDVWSLGVVLYRLVSGRLPFEGDTLGRVCMAVMRDPTPSLSAAGLPLPAGFVAVVERCLEKDRDRRFATVAALADALAPYAAAPGRFAQSLDDGEVTRPVEPVSAAASVPPGAPPATDFATSQHRVRTAAELHEPSAAPPWRSGVVLVGGALAVVTALVGVGTANAVRERQRAAASAAEAPAPSVAEPTPSPTPNAAVVSPGPVATGPVATGAP
ncbi:MAG TPA: serine/threonine-protein kinase, partial [Polyangiaceae bacterium]|nr:serine/threonine-protein kinase [Polyangiaceae bacterium]